MQESTAHIKLPVESKNEIEERDHLYYLYLRLIPFVYDFPGETIEKLISYLPLRLSAAEREYLGRRLSRVRRKKDVAVVSFGKDDVLLPLRPDFDPRKVPLVALWCDGGFYTPRERHSGKQNERKLRGLGLADGIAGYLSYRAVIFSPKVTRPAWKVEPFEVKNIAGSYEAEVKAVEAGLQAVINRLEEERNLPSVNNFHVVVHTDCQSLAMVLSRPSSPEESEIIRQVRQLRSYFAELHFIWQPRRRIKRHLGH